MQELLIQSLEIDWSEIDARDYLRSIHAIQAIERLEFHSPVTFFAGENGSGVPNGDIFCEQKVFTMWQHRKKTMQNCSACQRAITENRMARVFWHWHSRSSARKGCIC